MVGWIYARFLHKQSSVEGPKARGVIAIYHCSTSFYLFISSLFFLFFLSCLSSWVRIMQYENGVTYRLNSQPADATQLQTYLQGEKGEPPIDFFPLCVFFFFFFSFLKRLGDETT